MTSYSSYVLCTLILLSTVKTEGYPGQNIFSGIYAGKCDSVHYVDHGVSACITENVPKVAKNEENTDIFTTSEIVAMVTELCR